MPKFLHHLTRGVAVAAATALAGSFALVGAATPSSAVPGFAFSRISGANRFGTAEALAEAAFPSGAPTALIATGFNFPDALAGNYLAGLSNSPILLVNSSGALPPETLGALQFLKTTKVVILGGTSAVGADVANELAATPSTGGSGDIAVTRVSGLTRDDTAEAVDTVAGASAVGIFDGQRTAFLARDDTFPDALGAGPVAFNQHFPVILTTPTSLSPQAAATINALGIKQLIILGGTAAISTAVESAANAQGAGTLVRMAGIDRSDTSKLLADYAIANFGFKASSFAVASGDQAYGGADALAAGPYAAKADPIPLLVTNAVTDAGQVVAFGSEHSGTEATGVAVGGTTPLPDALLATITQAVAVAQGAPSYTVSPSTQQVLNVTGGAANVLYSVTGIPAGVPVDVYLYNCSNVSPAGGVFVFSNSSSPGSATNNDGVPGNTGNAVITKVNNATLSPSVTFVQNVQQAFGTLTFQVTDSSTGCVTPVIFTNAAANNLLTLGSTNEPTIAYGVGGQALFEQMASAGTIGGSTVSSFTGSQITAGGLTYNYASTDTYQIKTGGTCTASSYSAFKAALSVGDTLSGTYAPSGTSTFCLNDIAPGPPTGVTAVGSTAAGAGVTVSFTGPGSAAAPNIVGFDIYRAPATGSTCPAVAAASTSPQTPPASPYVKLGSNPTMAASTATAYSYTDTTVGSPEGAFCYSVSSVDASGQIGSGSVPVGPAPLAFSSASATGSTKTIVVTYNQPVLCTTVDADGSDFAVGTAATAGGPFTAATVASVTCAGSNTTTVSIVVSSTLTVGQFVKITSKAGTDTNTVGSAGTPEIFQVVGNSIVSSAIA